MRACDDTAYGTAARTVSPDSECHTVSQCVFVSLLHVGRHSSRLESKFLRVVLALAARSGARRRMDDVDLEAALTEAHAPVDEPATSADELDEDDEAVCLLSSLSSLHPGAWVVLHSLVRKPELNGRV